MNLIGRRVESGDRRTGSFPLAINETADVTGTQTDLLHKLQAAAVIRTHFSPLTATATATQLIKLRKALYKLCDY